MSSPGSGLDFASCHVILSPHVQKKLLMWEESLESLENYSFRILWVNDRKTFTKINESNFLLMFGNHLISSEVFNYTDGGEFWRR